MQVYGLLTEIYLAIHIVLEHKSFFIFLIVFILFFLNSAVFFFNFYLFMIVTERERESEREAGSMHWEPDVGFDPGSPGSRPGPKAGAKPLRHPGIPCFCFFS